MKAIVVSYSLTGNNEDLAAGVAATLGAEHVRITESKPRKMGKIVLDGNYSAIPSLTAIYGRKSEKQRASTTFGMPTYGRK
jgi:flavodoxin